MQPKNIKIAEDQETVNFEVSGEPCISHIQKDQEGEPYFIYYDDLQRPQAFYLKPSQISYISKNNQ